MTDDELKAIEEGAHYANGLFKGISGDEFDALIAEVRRLRAENAALREVVGVAKCEKCSGEGGYSVPCSDPQCGDSTWDHYCDGRYERCQHLSLKAALARIDGREAR